MGLWRLHGGLIWRENGFNANDYLDINVNNEEDREVYLSESHLIVPGLIDFHCHIWAPGAAVAVTDTEYISSGVIAAVDAGTFGYYGWENADRLWQNSPMEIRSWLSVLPEGLTIHPNPNPTKPENISIDRLVEMASIAGDRLYGYKVRLGQVDAKTDRGLLEVARSAAEKSGLKMMVHLTGSGLSINEVVEILRPGDVLTHPYHGQKGHVLDERGKASASFIEAVKRGLLLDVGQGSKHFAWKVFQQVAIEEGIKPHFISSDIVRNTWKKPPVSDMSHIVSRFIAGGLSKEEVFAAVLNNASNFMGLEFDYSNRVLVLEADHSEVSYTDSEGDSITSHLQYHPSIHINHGRVIFSHHLG
jgi:dihydroorotase